VKRIRCAEIWGGVRDLDQDVRTSAIDASLFSGAARGGRGGDIYYFSVCRADQLTRVALADVMGHGQPVSNTSQWLYDSLKTRMDDMDSHLVLSDVNRLADQYGYKAMTTAVVLAFLTEQAQMYFSYAGHHPIYVRRKGIGKWQPMDNRSPAGRVNLPLGVDPETTYAQFCEPIDEGDRLFLYTDGVLETPDAGGEHFGKARLIEVLEHHASRPPADMKSAVIDALRKHRGAPLDHDDVTVMAIEPRPTGGSRL
jgi:sigma-B regulation protein RsbU (phosphoserine phosphatase)